MVDRDAIQTIFRESLGLDDNVDVGTISYRSIDQWDSVAHMALVAALEDHFDVFFDTDDILDMSDLDKAIQILEKLVAG